MMCQEGSFAASLTLLFCADEERGFTPQRPIRRVKLGTRVAGEGRQANWVL